MLEDGIDQDMQEAVSKIMARPTEQDDSPKSVETKEARQVKGDLMMERDLIKHMKMVRSQLTNGEPMGTQDIEEQIKFLKEDLDFLLLNPESAGYTKIPYDSRKRRLELAQRIKALVDYMQYRLVTEHGCSIHAVLNEGKCMPSPLPNKMQGDWEQEAYGNSYRAYQPYYYGQGLANGAYPGGLGGGGRWRRWRRRDQNYRDRNQGKRQKQPKRLRHLWRTGERQVSDNNSAAYDHGIRDPWWPADREIFAAGPWYRMRPLLSINIAA